MVFFIWRGLFICMLGLGSCCVSWGGLVWFGLVLIFVFIVGIEFFMIWSLFCVFVLCLISWVYILNVLFCIFGY